MIGLVIILFILSALTIYFYTQTRYLTKNLNKERETENQKQCFLATLVHDLKTPTNAQLNTLNLLKKGTFGNLNSEQKEMINLTQESCKYMSNLIGTIMQTYNYDCGKIHLIKDNFDISNLVVELCDSTKVLCLQKNQKLELDYDKNVPIIIYADKLQIKRVILNLISNAITYGYSNTVIKISFKKNITNFEFCIKNMSKPISQSELKTIFDKYKKTEYARFNKTSSGLGLYLSKRIIELHHGKIFANSNSKGCCTFKFIIPTVKSSLLKSSNQKCRI